MPDAQKPLSPLDVRDDRESVPSWRQQDNPSHPVLDPGQPGQSSQLPVQSSAQLNQTFLPQNLDSQPSGQGYTQPGDGFVQQTQPFQQPGPEGALKTQPFQQQGPAFPQQAQPFQQQGSAFPQQAQPFQQPGPGFAQPFQQQGPSFPQKAQPFQQMGPTFPQQAQPFQQPGPGFAQLGFPQPWQQREASLKTPPPPLPITASFSEAFAFIRRRPGPGVGFPAVCLLPFLALQLIDLDNVALVSLLFFTFPAVYAACMGAVTLAATDPGGTELSAGRCLGRSFTRFGAYVGLAFVLLFIGFLAAIPVSIVMSMAVGVTGGRFPNDAGTFAMGLGFALLIAGFIMWVAMCFVLSVPALVAEGLGPMASIRRSSELTRGNRLRLSVMFLMVMALPLAVSLLTGTAPGVLSGTLRPGTGVTIRFALMFMYANALGFSLLATVYAYSTSLANRARVEEFSDVF